MLRTLKKAEVTYYETANTAEALQPLEKVETPNVKTAQELADF